MTMLWWPCRYRFLTLRVLPHRQDSPRLPHPPHQPQRTDQRQRPTQPLRVALRSQPDDPREQHQCGGNCAASARVRRRHRHSPPVRIGREYCSRRPRPCAPPLLPQCRPAPPRAHRAARATVFIQPLRHVLRMVLLAPPSRRSGSLSSRCRVPDRAAGKSLDVKHRLLQQDQLRLDARIEPRAPRTAQQHQRERMSFTAGRRSARRWCGSRLHLLDADSCGTQPDSTCSVATRR